MMRLCLAVVALCCLAGGAAAADPAAACAAGYPAALRLDPARLAERGGAAPGLEHVWGRERMAVRPPEAGTDGPVLRVSYPKGSVNPGNKATPGGGAGFQWMVPGLGDAACLGYRVRFPDGFAFVRGGKLPGLFGGDAPRGCSPRDLSAGFSARLMWREGGAGELYLYAPDRETRCGTSLGRGAWRFPTGRWVDVAQEVRMNAPSRSDGVVRLWVDGRPVFEATGLTLREESGVAVAGLLFSTFFGGDDADWASPSDQTVDFADMTVRRAGP